jgi:hypothetical protein
VNLFRVKNEAKALYGSKLRVSGINRISRVSRVSRVNNNGKED